MQLNKNVLFLSWVGTIVIAFYLAFEFGSLGQKSVETKYADAMREWKTERAAIVSHSDSVTAYVKTLETERVRTGEQVVQKEKEISRLSSRMTTMRKRNDSLLVQLSTSLPDTCDSAITLATSYRSEADTLRKLVGTLESRDTLRTADINNLVYQKSLLLTSNDSLRKLVIRVPEYKQKKFLGFIPMPSRTTTLVAGTLAGLATGIYITR